VCGDSCSNPCCLSCRTSSSTWSTGSRSHIRSGYADYLRIPAVDSCSNPCCSPSKQPDDERRLSFEASLYDLRTAVEAEQAEEHTSPSHMRSARMLKAAAGGGLTQSQEDMQAMRRSVQSEGSLSSFAESEASNPRSTRPGSPSEMERTPGRERDTPDRTVGRTVASVTVNEHSPSVAMSRQVKKHEDPAVVDLLYVISAAHSCSCLGRSRDRWAAARALLGASTHILRARLCTPSPRRANSRWWRSLAPLPPSLRPSISPLRRCASGLAPKVSVTKLSRSMPRVVPTALPRLTSATEDADVGSPRPSGLRLGLEPKPATDYTNTRHRSPSDGPGEFINDALRQEMEADAGGSNTYIRIPLAVHVPHSLTHPCR